MLQGQGYETLKNPYGAPLAASASSTAGNAPLPMSPMQEARSSLTASVNYLHERMADLERRLDVVCVPSPPTGADSAGNKIERQPSELRSFLIEQASGVHAAVSRIESLLARLEL